MGSQALGLRVLDLSRNAAGGARGLVCGCGLGHLARPEWLRRCHTEALESRYEILFEDASWPLPRCALRCCGLDLAEGCERISRLDPEVVGPCQRRLHRDFERAPRRCLVLGG